MLFLEKTPDMSPLDYDIYNYIIGHMEQVVFMRIRELAENTHTSVATIQRFCTKFDCSGFSEFRIRLKLFLAEEKNRSSKILIDTSSQIHFLTRVNEQHFQEKFQRAISIIQNKELILFLGVGSSNVMAEYGALYFSSVFQMALRIEDPITNPRNYLSKRLLENACVIALSVSGETKEIIHYLKSYSFKDTPIISITNSANSTIAKLSTINIPYYITEEKMWEQDITSQLAPLFIIEHLAKTLHNLKL